MVVARRAGFSGEFSAVAMDIRTGDVVIEAMGPGDVGNADKSGESSSRRGLRPWRPVGPRLAARFMGRTGGRRTPPIMGCGGAVPRGPIAAVDVAAVCAG